MKVTWLEEAREARPREPLADEHLSLPHRRGNLFGLKLLGSYPRSSVLLNITVDQFAEENQGVSYG